MNHIIAIEDCKQQSAALNTPKVRDSQMELLRIVAMSMILIHHFVAHGSPYDIYVQGLGFQNSFVFYGVNLFVMISGYYGIKVRWKSFLSLIITVMFFVIIDALLTTTGSWYANGCAVFGLDVLKEALLVPFKMYWFVSCYMVLYMFAPVINIGLKNATQVQLRTIVVIVLCYSVYGGLVFDYAIDLGYTVTQFMLLYITGFWIKTTEPFAKVPAWQLGVAVLLCSVISGSDILTLLIGSHTGLRYSLSYINLFCYAGSIAIFVLFTRLSFSNRFVNTIAGASFGCYLLQEGRLGYGVLYELQEKFFLSHPFAEALLMYAASFVGLWVASWVLTWFKNLWAPKLIDAICQALPERWKQTVW